MKELQKEIEEFIQNFHSVCLATLNKENLATCSYAPFFRFEGRNFIYISELSEHFENIKNHPFNLELMFLEDESKAFSFLMRKRLRFRSRAYFIERGEEFDALFDVWEKCGDETLKMLRMMKDFHLIELKFDSGRFVKGFGLAYDIKDEEIVPVVKAHK